MALIQTGLIWVAYAVAIALLFAIASIFVYIYQKPRDRAASVTTVCILTVSALLATILLLPVDVALISSTVSSKDGIRKAWATQERVDRIVFTLQVVYYTLYSLDAALCLLAIPFTYFFYEENDEVDSLEDEQSTISRFWGALKYTTVFLLLCVILFLVGFFVPAATYERGQQRDLDYFKRLLTENRGEKSLSFAVGLLTVLGTIACVLYTASGMALLPVTFVRSAPSISARSLAATTRSELEQNRERQRQLEGRNEGHSDGLDARDRRELEALVHEERSLVRRERVAAQDSSDGRHWLMRAWLKTEVVFRPVKLIGGLVMFLVALLIFASMLVTGIDKARNSICGPHCGYLLGEIHVFQPINWIFVQSARIFPIDYVFFLLLVLFFFASSVVGVATVGIRFLWITLFRISKGKTSPQAMLIATVLLALMILAINYTIAMMVAPQYTTWGPQTYCDRPDYDCSADLSAVKSCSEVADSNAAITVCTPTVVSTFINRITVNFPIFGLIAFWAQFAFLAVYLLVMIATLFRTPRIDTAEYEDYLEDEEEEGLLASSGRRFDATWQDITGLARQNNPGNYGAT